MIIVDDDFHSGVGGLNDGFTYEAVEKIKRMFDAAIMGGQEGRSDLKKVAGIKGNYYPVIANYLLSKKVEGGSLIWWKPFKKILQGYLKKYSEENISLSVLEKWRNIIGVPDFPKRDQGMTLVESCILWLHEAEKKRGGAFNALLQGKVPSQKLGKRLGHEICEGLIVCCKIGAIQIPDRATKLQFLAAYYRWYNRNMANASPEYLQKALDIDLAELGDETLLNLYGQGYRLAEYELGRRLIFLPANDFVQKGYDYWAWNREALATLQKILPSSIESDGEKIKGGVEGVELYVLHEAHRDKQVKNPDDPFDYPVHQLWLLSDRSFDPYEIKTPDFKKTLDYVQRHKAELEEKMQRDCNV